MFSMFIRCSSKFLEYEAIAFSSLREDLFRNGYGQPRGWDDPNIWRDFADVMFLRPHDRLVSSPQSARNSELGRLILSTKSKRGKVGSLSGGNNLPKKKKTKPFHRSKLSPSKSLPQMRPLQQVDQNILVPSRRSEPPAKDENSNYVPQQRQSNHVLRSSQSMTLIQGEGNNFYRSYKVNLV